MTSLSVENNDGRTSGALSLFYNWCRHRINDGYTVDPNDTNNPKDYRNKVLTDVLKIFRGSRTYIAEFD